METRYERIMSGTKEMFSKHRNKIFGWLLATIVGAGLAGLVIDANDRKDKAFRVPTLVIDDIIYHLSQDRRELYFIDYNGDRELDKVRCLDYDDRVDDNGFYMAKKGEKRFNELELIFEEKVLPEYDKPENQWK